MEAFISTFVLIFSCNSSANSSFPIFSAKGDSHRTLTQLLHLVLHFADVSSEVLHVVELLHLHQVVHAVDFETSHGILGMKRVGSASYADTAVTGAHMVLQLAIQNGLVVVRSPVRVGFISVHHTQWTNPYFFFSSGS